VKIALYILGGLVGLVVLFVGWSIWSVVRGGRRRDERLITELEPLAQRLAGNGEVTASEVATLAQRPELRYPLHALLKEHGRSDLFPGDWLNLQSEAEASLAYWLMHPHELQDRPERMELVATQTRKVGERDGRFFIFRYRMAEGHWAAKDGWLLGAAGPSFEDDGRYARLVSAFSRAGDREGSLTPGELVDWYVGMLRQKGMIPS
jgi:hypothetical protein